jgi:MFS family permease
MTIESHDTQQQSLLNSDRKEANYDATATTNGDINNAPHRVKEAPHLSLVHIACILSTAFSYGCIMTTLFLITLPVECERIEKQHPNTPKSVALGIFVAIAGLTQLVSPLIGMFSDTYNPPAHHELGQRMPYLCLGAILCVAGLLGQYIESYEKLWLRYGLFFFCDMIGLNIIYGMMIALIPDQVPRSQTGIANGILAFLLVTGSLFGFGLFHIFIKTDIQDMYGKYKMNEQQVGSSALCTQGGNYRISY